MGSTEVNDTNGVNGVNGINGNHTNGVNGTHAYGVNGHMNGMNGVNGHTPDFDGKAFSAANAGLDYDVLIVGAGLSGILSLYRMRELGLRTRVLEAGSGEGGTWFW